MIPAFDFVLCIDDVGYGAPDFFFQYVVGLIMALDCDLARDYRYRYGDYYWDDFTIIGITGDASVGIEFVSFGLYTYRRWSFPFLVGHSLCF